MRHILYGILLLLSTQFTIAQSTNYSKVKINLLTTPISEVAALGLEVDHGIFAKDRHLINDYSETEIALLQANGIDYEILIEDVKAWYQAGQHRDHKHDHPHIDAHPQRKSAQDCNTTGTITYESYITPENYEPGSMAGYLTYSELLETLDQMQALYPNLITAKQPIGDYLTEEGRPIYWLTISDNPNEVEGEPEILYDALHHAREPNSLSQLIFYMWYLLENYATNDEIKYLVDNTQMYFIPCVNPDGYIYNETTDPNGGGLWRKNRWVNPANNNSTGVDLNRNYGFGWGYDNSGSSPNTNSDTYRGTEAFSEVETRAVRDFCIERNIQIALNFHTYGNLFTHPWGYNDDATDDDDVFQAFGEVMTRDNNAGIGTAIETVGYTVNGDSDDWMYGDEESKPKIFAVTPEVGPENYGFWPPESEIDNINKSNLLQNITAAHLLLNYAEVEGSGGSLLTEATGLLPIDLKKYGLATGDLTISVTAASSNLSVDFAPQTVNLGHLETYNLPVNYTIEPSGMSVVEEVEFLVEIDNGTWTKTETIRKDYIDGFFTPAFEDNIDNTENWEVNNGTWTTTESTFYSAPTSMTDSPTGEYNANQNSTIATVNNINLTNSTTALLRFQARWAIETGYDYVQVMACTNGTNCTPLCGKYTKVGSQYQDEGQPVYDGFQAEWILEEIDLSDYLGEDISIRFRLISDGYVEEDGFYFDDIILETIEDTPIECLTITNIDTLSTDLEAAEFTWDAFVDAEAYEFRYKKETEPASDWTILSITTNTILIEDLSICENYEAQVKSICGVNESDYSDSFTFKTDCPETSLSAIGIQNLEIYPNPFNEAFTVELSTLPTTSRMNLTVLNQLGQTVQSQKIDINAIGKQSINISLPTAPKGIYFLKISDETGQAYYHKIVRL